MKFLDSRLYTHLETRSNFFLLNLLWLLLSIPIVTIFPATAAMFGVIRGWKLKKQTGVFFLFFHHFKQNFFRSFLYGILWSVFTIVFYIDFMLLGEMGPIMNLITMVILIILGFILLFISIYLFPVMVHYDLSFFNTLKFAFYYSFMYIHYTLLAILLCFLTVIVGFVFPIVLVFSFSLTAYIVYSLCFKSFDKTREIIKKKNV